MPLPDLNTQDPDVVSQYGRWIQSFVEEYEVDGLRIDGLFLSLSPVIIIAN